MHEGADIEPDLRPQRLVVGFEHDPLGAAIETFLDEERRPAHRHVLPVGGERIGAVERARAPADVAVDREIAQAVDAERIERAVLEVRHQVGEALDIAQPRLGAGGRLPHAARRVGARPEPGDRTARGE